MIITQNFTGLAKELYKAVMYPMLIQMYDKTNPKLTGGKNYGFQT